MKKLLFFCFLCLLMSCNQDEFVNVEDTQSYLESNNPKSAGDGKYDLLGYGYDITGIYLDLKSSTYSVLDVDKLIRIESGYQKKPVEIGLTTSYDTYYYYGYNGSEYIQEINRKVVSNNGANGGSKDDPLSALGGKLVSFTATLNVDTDNQSKKTYISKDSYARSETVVRVKQLKINRLPRELYPYLSEDFKQHVKTYTADELVRTYGTHVLTDIAIGGRLFVDSKSTYIEDNSYSNKKTHIKAGLNVGLKFIGFNTDNDITNTDIETINKKNISQHFHIKSLGSDLGIDATFDLTDVNPPKIQSQKDFIDAVNRLGGVKAALAEVNWSKAYLLYEFIEDPVKKEQVKNAIIKYVKNAQLEEINVIPLIQWYNPRDKSYVYTSDSDYNYGSGWERGPVVAFVYKKQEAESVPLIQWYNSKDKNYAYTCDPNYNYGSGWQRGPVVAYLPKANHPSAVPLIQWYNPRDKSYAYTSNPDYFYGSGWERGPKMAYVFSVK